MSTSKQEVRNNRRLTAAVIRAISLAYITQKAGFSRGAAVIQHRSFVTQSNKILRNSQIRKKMSALCNENRVIKNF